MGLASKLSTLNNANTNYVNGASAPVAEGGYNAQNMPGIPAAPALTAAELAEINRLNQQPPPYAPLPAYNSNANLAIPPFNNNNNNNNQKPLSPNAGEIGRNAINNLVVEKIWRIVNVNKLQHFFANKPRKLQAIVDRACKHDYQMLRMQWEIPTIEMATDLSILSLYDIVILGDDSGSMKTVEAAEGVDRVQILKEVVGTVAFWSTLFDDDGVVVRFLNSDINGDGVSNQQTVKQLFGSMTVGGGTPLGAMLQRKIIRPIFQPLLQSGQLEKPVLVIILTDGIADSELEVKQVINEARAMAGRSPYGERAISFSFAQIGTDAKATRFLNTLDVDPEVGHLIDCTSNFEEERRQCGDSFTASQWMVKLMVGAVDPSYDAADEEDVVPNARPVYHDRNQQQPPPQQQHYTYNNNNAGGGSYRQPYPQQQNRSGGSQRVQQNNDSSCSVM